MPYLIGADEAGYGPNLGPLVISATVWHVRSHKQLDLFERLSGCVSPTLCRDGRIALGDSKALYRSGDTLAALERGLLAAMQTAGFTPCDLDDYCDIVEADRHGHRHALPWHIDYQATLPSVISRDDLDLAADRLARGMKLSGIRLVAVRSQAIFPSEFNRRVTLHDSKGTTLSEATLELVRDSLAIANDEPAFILCDKHGGRNRYQELLQRSFPDDLVEVRGEARDESRYQFGPKERRVDIRFRSKGEAHLPTALASMASKYLREQMMHAFNAFWRTHLPDLRPTAGYPVDARRFKLEIEAVQTSLGIDDNLVWRCR